MSLSTARMAEISIINPPMTSEPTVTDEPVAFVPMAAVSAESATVHVSDTRPLSTMQNGFSYFQNGDILVAKITPCFENGKIAQACIQQAHGFGSTEFLVVRANQSRVDPRFLLHFLRQNRIRIEGQRKMTGSAGQRRVPKHFLENLEIPLLPLAEQRRIAAILDQAEALRTKRRHALTKLGSLTHSIFLNCFDDPVSNPNMWKRIPLYELLESIDSGWSPTCLDRPAKGGEWGVLKLGAVTWCEYNPYENKALPSNLEPDPTLEVKQGDLLFTRKNTYELVAACALVRDTPPRLMMSDLIFRLHLRPNAPLITPYLHQLLINPRKRREIQKLAGGSSGSMPNISKSRLMAVLIEVPPLSIQHKFAAQIEAVERMKSSQRASLAKLNELFASLQHRAFRGEL